MTTKYDIVYYYKRGIGWFSAGVGRAPGAIATKVNELRAMGYWAVPGKSSIGAPETAPDEVDIRAVERGNLPALVLASIARAEARAALGGKVGAA